MKFLKDSYLIKTGQCWKLFLFLFCIVTGSVFILYGLYLGICTSVPDSYHRVRSFSIMIFSGIVLLFASSMWLIFSVRCPACKVKLLAKAIRSKPPQEWLVWLLTIKNCPFCGKIFD